MGLFSRKKSIMKVDIKMLSEAMIRNVLYLFLEKPMDKIIKEKYMDICGSEIEIRVNNDKENYIIKLVHWETGLKNYFDTYLVICCKGKKPVDVNQLYNGLDRLSLRKINELCNSKTIAGSLYNNPPTAGFYMKKNKAYSSQTYDEFMENGGFLIERHLNTTKDNLNEIDEFYKSKLSQSWQKKAYEQIMMAYKTKKLDLLDTELHEHMTRKQFKRLKFIFFDTLGIEVINDRKRKFITGSMQV